MKKLLFPILLLALLFSQSACHKYPDDIPDWLKDKIKGLEKETRWHKGCLNEHCMTIHEFKMNGAIFYFFDPGDNTYMGLNYYKVYNYHGIEQCDFVPANPIEACPYDPAEYIRLIWSEKD